VSTQKTLNQLFKEVYWVGLLDPKREAKYWLIDHFREKVSQRLFDEQVLILQEGKDAFSKFLGEATSKPNPFLKTFKIWDRVATFPMPDIKDD
jgi:hypothetical protein